MAVAAGAEAACCCSGGRGDAGSAAAITEAVAPGMPCLIVVKRGCRRAGVRVTSRVGCAVVAVLLLDPELGACKSSERTGKSGRLDGGGGCTCEMTGMLLVDMFGNCAASSGSLIGGDCCLAWAWRLNHACSIASWLGIVGLSGAPACPPLTWVEGVGIFLDVRLHEALIEGGGVIADVLHG